ncbi:TPA: hypothetical protein ACWLU8_001326 [Morganella morganii]
MKAFNILIGVILVFALSFSFYSFENKHIVYPPSVHEKIMYGVLWDVDVAHSENNPVNCRSPDSFLSSQCYVVLRAGDDFPKNASSIDIRIKNKLWGKGGKGYCLSYMSNSDEKLNYNNHLSHNEIWFDGENRKISYTTATIPVVNNKVTFGIGKQISGDCVIETVFYLEGYTKKYLPL